MKTPSNLEDLLPSIYREAAAITYERLASLDPFDLAIAKVDAAHMVGAAMCGFPSKIRAFLRRLFSQIAFIIDVAGRPQKT